MTTEEQDQTEAEGQLEGEPEQQAEGEQPEGEQQPKSRRSRIAQRALDELKAFKESYERERAEERAQRAAEREEWARRQEEAREHIGRLTGTLEEFRQRQTDSKREDPAELRRQADAHLKQGDYDRYRELDTKAWQVELKEARESAKREAFDEFKKNAPQQMDPMTMAMIAKYPEVVADPNGFRAVYAEAQVLQAYGAQPGPQLVAKAWENAHARMKARIPAANGAPPNGARYDQSAAGALAGISPGAGVATPAGAGEAPKLSELEAQIAKEFKITPSEYLKWKNKSRS